jgi:hypothetical protein
VGGSGSNTRLQTILETSCIDAILAFQTLTVAPRASTVDSIVSVAVASLKKHKQLLEDEIKMKTYRSPIGCSFAVSLSKSVILVMRRVLPKEGMSMSFRKTGGSLMAFVYTILFTILMPPEAE